MTVWRYDGMRFECTLLRPSHFTWNETGGGFRLIFLQCQCGSIFAGWDPPRVVKHHYSSFTHLGNSLRIQHQLNRVSLILGGFPHQAISAFWLSWSQWKLPKPMGPSLPTTRQQLLSPTVANHSSSSFACCCDRFPWWSKENTRVKWNNASATGNLNVHWEVQPRWSCAQFLQPQSICLLFV